MKMHIYANEQGTREGVVFDNESDPDFKPTDFEGINSFALIESHTIPETYGVSCFTMYEREPS